MNIVQHKDKSEDWLAWRKTGIGSSDAPIIMGVSDWATPFQLWEQKTGVVERDDTTSYIQDKGNQAEVYARAQWELINGCEAPARLGQHAEHVFLLASADSFAESLGKGAEYKLGGREDHEGVRAGKVPQKYFPQVQHQMLVFGVKEWDYCSYYVEKGQPIESGELLVTTVKADIDWMIDYVLRAEEFWKCVQTKTPPPLTDGDVRLIKKKETVDIALKFVEESKKLDAQAAIVDDLKEKLKAAADGFSKATFGTSGVTFTKSFRKGNVDYKNVPELLGVDLEPYRAKGSFAISVAPPKESKKTSKKAVQE